MSTPLAGWEPGKLEEIATLYSEGIERLSKDVLYDIAREYAGVRRLLVDRVAELSRQIEAAQASGEEVTPAWLFQRDRLQAIELEITLEVSRIAHMANESIRLLQDEAVKDALAAALKLTEAQMGGPAPLRTRILTNWSRVNLQAAIGALGASAGGSPLEELFSSLGPQAGSAIRSALIASVATGIPTKQMARYVANALGGNFARALTISRTETMRAYRLGHRAAYQKNPIVTGWTWHSRLDPSTCAGCFTAHGTVHPQAELMESHPNCRCIPIPRTPSWEELGFSGLPDTRPPIEDAEAAFKRLALADQRRILGPSIHRLFESGSVPWGALGRTTDAGRWGKNRIPTPLHELLARLKAGEFGLPPATPLPSGTTSGLPAVVESAMTAAVPELRALRGGEQLRFYDVDGRLQYQQGQEGLAARSTGVGYGVDIAPDAWNKLRGLTQVTPLYGIHNHPNGWNYPESDPRHAGGSFSWDDIATSADIDAAAMRVVSPLYTFTMKPPATGWPTLMDLRFQYDHWSFEIQTAGMKRLFGVVSRAGEESAEYKQLQAALEAAHYDAVWRKVADTLGLIYTKEER